MRSLAYASCSLLLLAACGSDDSTTPALDAGTADTALDATPPPPPQDGSTVDVAPPTKTFLATYPLAAKFPEGGTYDPVGHAFFVGSLADGSVHRVGAATGAETTLFTESAPGKWWTLGMDVDSKKQTLWVCAMDDRSPKPRAGFVWTIDLKTNQRIAVRALSAAANDATCTDVVLAADGTAYVVDREIGNVYKIDSSGTPSLFVSSSTLKGTFVGQNAVVILPDQSALLSVVYGVPALVHVNLGTKAVTKVTIAGTFFDGTPLAGADGMAFADGSAWVMFSSKLVKVTPTLADWSSAKSNAVDVPNGMTDIVATPNGLYLLNGQSIRFALGTTPDPFALTRFTGTL